MQTTQITPLQGFDRLRDAGFSDEDIATMREEFRAAGAASAPVDGGASSPYKSGSSSVLMFLFLYIDEDEHARALEDQWMEGLTAQNDGAADHCSSGCFLSPDSRH